MQKKYLKIKFNIDSWLKSCNKLGIEGNLLHLIKGIYKSLECGKTNEDYLDPSPHCITTAFLAVGWSSSKIPGNTIPTIALVSSDNPEGSSWWKHKSNKSELCVLYCMALASGPHPGWLTMMTALYRTSVVKKVGGEAVCWPRIEVLRARPWGRKLAFWLSQAPPGNQSRQSASHRKTTGSWRWDFWISGSSRQLSRSCRPSRNGNL